MKTLIKLLVLLCCTTALFSQEQTTAILETPQVSGLHKIKVPHGIRSYSYKDLRDFRIWDSLGNQVPYFVQKASIEITSSNFVDLEIIKTERKQDTNSYYIFKNTKGPIRQIALNIANYRGTKYYDLFGSNDQKQWFGIAKSQSLNKLNSINNTTVYKSIYFPYSSYNYFKIVFNDLNSLPLNILKIVVNNEKAIAKQIEEIKPKIIETSNLKEPKKTRIKIQFTHPEVIDQIVFDVETPKFYKRKTIVYTEEKKEVNHKKTIQRNLISSFTLDSENSNKIKFPSFFGEELYIEIENLDNPELLLSKISFFQNSLYAIADLKLGESYTITSADKTLSRPQYDISYFKDKVSKNTPLINIQNVIHKIEKQKENKEISFWQQAWFMWVSIGLAAALIIFVISGLVKDMKKQDTT